jgi:hypothetical protein
MALNLLEIAGRVNLGKQHFPRKDSVCLGPRREDPMLNERQLRLMIGDEAYDALPDRKPRSFAHPPRPKVQRRPRIEARQRIILGGYIPAIVAAGFTVAEQAVLCVFAYEVKRHGRCALTVGEIAYKAQCCRTIVQRALRQAQRYGLIAVDHRRVARDRNLANIVRIVSRVWLAWLRLGPSRPRPWGRGGWVYESVQTPKRYKKEVVRTGGAGGISASPPNSSSREGR